MDSNEWDIKIPPEGDLESKLRAIEKQLAGQVKEFIFILDLEGNNLYRAKGTGAGIPETKELREILLGRQVIIITHNYPSGDLNFSLADLEAFFQHRNIEQLRVTSGKETAILNQAHRKMSYSSIKMNLKKNQFDLLRIGKITQKEYDSWIEKELPLELCKNLPLNIILIDLQKDE